MEYFPSGPGIERWILRDFTRQNNPDGLPFFDVIIYFFNFPVPVSNPGKLAQKMTEYNPYTKSRQLLKELTIPKTKPLYAWNGESIYLSLSPVATDFCGPSPSPPYVSRPPSPSHANSKLLCLSFEGLPQLAKHSLFTVYLFFSLPYD